MAARRNPTYARAYSFGTDGNAALAGDPISTQRYVSRPPVRRPRPKKRGVTVMRWSILAFWLAVALLLLSTYGNANERKRSLENDIALQAVYLTQAKEKIAEVDDKLLIAADETRIRSVAANRLGMTQPDEAQIRHIPRPYVATRQAEYKPQSNEGVSLFRLLLSTFGR